MNKQMNYEKAITELEAIVDRMEHGLLDLDSLTAELKRAQSLIKLCRSRIKKTDDEIAKLLSDE